MELLDVFYILAAVFGLGFAVIAAFGTWIKPEFLRDKSIVPLTLLSVVLFAATLGTAISGAIAEDENENKEKAAEKAATE
jgi:hypothetical protein